MAYVIRDNFLLHKGTDFHLLESDDENIIEGNLYLKQQKINLAKKCYKKSLPSAVAHYCLGLVYNVKANYDAMIKHYLAAVEYNCSYAMSNLGAHYRQQGDNDSMIKYYLLAIEHNNANAMHRLGYHYHSLRDYDTMMQYYSMAINNNYAKSIYNVGVHYRNLHDEVKAAKYYLLAIENGYVSDASHNLGMHYSKLQDYSESLKYYALSIDNGNTNANANANLNVVAQKIDDISLLVKYKKYLNRMSINKLNCAFIRRKSEHNICFDKSNI